MTRTHCLAELQQSLTQYLRDPERVPAPQGVEQRRLDVYRELIFNNVEGFLSSGFPILRSLHSESGWLRLVRAFFQEHRAHSPYFLEIGREFYDFVAGQSSVPLPPFAVELMHYEWVELALDVAPEQLPEAPEVSLQTQTSLSLSALAWPLAYQYPVHQIGPENQPSHAPEQPTFLVVYRDRLHKVRFMALNAMSYALLAYCADHPATTLQGLNEMFTHQFQQVPTPQFAEQLAVMVQRFVDQDIILIGG